MAFLLVLVLVTVCAAVPEDLSGKQMIFPVEGDTAHVTLTTSTQSFTAATVCLRFMTDLTRTHALFSVATSSTSNAFLIFRANDEIFYDVDNNRAKFGELDYTLNVWHSICATWDSSTGLVRLWFDGNPTVFKFTTTATISDPSIVLGQEQDSIGGGFSTSQSFTGIICDVHMWDYVLSSCEIHRYVNDLNFTPGNMLNWRALEYTITGDVLVENKDEPCDATCEESTHSTCLPCH
ncbi:uncharacterized protein V6R79_026396 [Siganus canaliculatus]